MTKQELRKQYTEKRLAIPDRERRKLDDLLLINFQQLDIPPFVETVMSYWPLETKGEVNTFLITDFLEFRMPGLQLAFPVSDFTNHSMKPMLVNDDTDYVRNEYGIAEPVNCPELSPKDIDMVIVPLLAFDRMGYRLGYGKGFYDRFLAQCRADVFRLGLCYFEPLDALPGIDHFDVPLSACVTPATIYEF
ncbi:5-formyltetrahydrofolate cyclo-ligase [Flavihumibacter rivuli]|uniref:5-formyltetrahydrofolate cyclo-ligase n=1 Tax=Flavihumibacter rivuli TaxID=2838156 RepID=UPI001BDEED7F|nr:5-formyltetrahydrofolate cyclo-ligase [Flavihumibacter rivuli]ULQ57723.1 5-formyltetrahydrofolate cyclo-ligase [Flavihumibacter rivuli]